MSIVAFQQFFQGEGQGGACPTITVGSMNFAGGAIPTVGVSITGGAVISGGAAGYTLTGTTGTVPTGMTCAVANFAGTWYVTLTSTPTTFGRYTFTANGEDSNGCPFSKTFTIDVWEGFEGTANLEDGDFTIAVSGLPTQLGVNVALANVESDISVDVGSPVALDQMSSTIQSPDAYDATLYPEGSITGNTVTNAIFYPAGTGNPYINTGSSPYTGNWDALNDWSLWDVQNPNGNWNMANQSTFGTPEGTVTIKLTFKPI